MKKRALYTLLALALALVVTLPMALPVGAAPGGEISAGKDTVKPADQPPDVYLVGQTVLYTLDLGNPSATDPMEITITDNIPVDYVGEFIGQTVTYWWHAGINEWVLADPGTIVTVPPSEEWTGSFSYEIQAEDVYVHPITGASVVINQLSATGFVMEQPTPEFVEGRVNKTIRVIQPDIRLDKTVSPGVAQVGQWVTYTFTITNMGDWPLENIILVDDVFGDLTDQLPAGLVLARSGDPGDSRSFDYPYQIQDTDPDPLENEATVWGTAQGFDSAIEGAVVTDEDDAVVRIEDDPSVGGEGFVGNKAAILGRWIALAGLVVGGVAMLRRRSAEIG